MVPIALVLPSRNTILRSFLKYSGFLINLNLTVALSPVRRCSSFIVSIVAVCRTLPTWTVSIPYVYVATWATAWQNKKWPIHPVKIQISLAIRVFTVGLKKPWVLSYPLSTQRRLISLSGCPADPTLRWVHRSFCWFCFAAAHFIIFMIANNQRIIGLVSLTWDPVSFWVTLDRLKNDLDPWYMYISMYSFS